MKLTEYLKEEKIEGRVLDVFSKADKVLSKDLSDELNEIKQGLDSHPRDVPEWLHKFYDFYARHDLYEILWKYRIPKTKKNVEFVLEEGIKDCCRVLDVGCADGLKTVFYAMNNPKTEFVGIDFSKESVKNAERRAKKYGLDNVRFVQANLLNCCFEPESFDSVIATYILHENYDICYGYTEWSGMEAVYKFDTQIKIISKMLQPTGRTLITISAVWDSRKDVIWQIENAAKKAGLKNGKIMGRKYGKGDKSAQVLDFVCTKQ